jgi:hypothetical protein
MERAIAGARDEGHLRADADGEQMLFEIHGLILALHYEARFLKSPGSIARANEAFANVLRRWGAEPISRPAAGKAARATKSSTKE